MKMAVNKHTQLPNRHTQLLNAIGKDVDIDDHQVLNY